MKNNFIIMALFLILLGCSQQQKEKSKDNEEIVEKELSHDELMASVLPKAHNIKTIGVLVYDGVNSLDVFGPRYILSQIMGAKTQLIALKLGNVTSVTGIEFVPDTTIDQVNSLDVLVIPGGFKGTIEAAYDKEVQDWIRKIDKTTTYTTSVCTGAWILGSTGLLKGKKATTNWFRAKEMLAKYGAKFTGKRYTKDGKYWTSAGVTAGMDMSLALLEEIVGRNYAEGVMLDVEYDPFPPFEGGSPEKTTPEVLQFMTTMYAAGVDPIIAKLEKEKPEVTSK
ncbi:DJ-1/PfpI family protein [Tenacibaculum sp. MAR_2009_124]|uniref:DJ-1/PfpI family protein n=1 Tax=Tenacibaculum sp. MAR_2009_124 TaxID=1250059 RepID=UPI0008976CA7|nr:DJ-1/PfpI family protein [Tenacibaculum sp. MAR_2009_124]SEC23811.1 DJ-1/PfpI family protein [Tenacibaculum sp. MAR_2009_124]